MKFEEEPLVSNVEEVRGGAAELGWTDNELSATSARNWPFKKTILSVVCGASAALLFLLFQHPGAVQSAAPQSFVTGLSARTRVKKGVAKALTASTCQPNAANIHQIFSSTNKSFDAPWPSVNKAALESISQCLTMLPLCDPSNLQGGTKHIRLTYIHASSSSVLTKYMDLLQNDALMADLAKQTCGGKGDSCSDEDFAGAVEQIILEVTQLQQMAAYYNSISTILDGISARFMEAVQENLQILLLASTKETSTTTAAPKHIWMKVLSLSIDVLNIVGTCMGVPDIKGVSESTMKTVNGVGTFLTSTATVAAAAQNIGQTSVGIENSKSGTSASSAPTALQEGEEEDEQLDEDGVALQVIAQKMVTKWQQELAVQRNMITSNWGRLQSAQGLFQNCGLGSLSISVALDSATPGIDWFALSLLIPNKYVIYAQRDYQGSTCSNSDASCYAPCSGLSGGCFKARREVSDFYYTSGPYESASPAITFWLGQVGEPKNGPPSGFWSYLLREDGPFASFIIPYLSVISHPCEGYTSMKKCPLIQKLATYIASQGATASQAAEYVEDKAEYVEDNKQSLVRNAEMRAASDVILAQCQFAPKTYVSETALSSGNGLGSTQPMKCMVFGAPWEIQWLPDCEACNTMNGFYCDSSLSSVACPTYPVANFNQQIWVPRNAHHYVDKSAGLRGCCMPDDDGVLDICDFPVCDCATVAAAVRYQGGSLKFIDNPLWWGLCDDDYYSASWQSNVDFPEGYVETSLGLTWPQVYQSYHYLKNVSSTLSSMTWKEAAKTVKKNAEAHPAQVEKILAFLKSKADLLEQAEEATGDFGSPTSCRRRKSCGSGSVCQVDSRNAGMCTNSQGNPLETTDPVSCSAGGSSNCDGKCKGHVCTCGCSTR